VRSPFLDRLLAHIGEVPQEAGVRGGLAYDTLHGRSSAPDRPCERDQLRDRSPVHIDADPLAGLNATEHLSCAVPQIARRHITHGYECITDATYGPKVRKVSATPRHSHSVSVILCPTKSEPRAARLLTVFGDHQVQVEAPRGQTVPRVETFQPPPEPVMGDARLAQD